MRDYVAQKQMHKQLYKINTKPSLKRNFMMPGSLYVRVKQIEKYFRNANKAFRVALRKLYKISISQLCECENQMEAYFEQWPFKLYFSELTKGHLSAWWICNTGDHTRACGFAHNLCKCSSINPQCDPSAHWQITNRIGHPSDCKIKYKVSSDAFFLVVAVCKWWLGSLNNKSPEKKMTRQLIFTKQGESKGKPYSFLGCHTISVSTTLSTFRDRKSAPRCDFSTVLFTCHNFFLSSSWSNSFNVSFPCLCIDRKGPKDSDFPGFSFRKKSSKQSWRRRSNQAFCEIASIL